jgi:thymidylate synthase (FAD)
MRIIEPSYGIETPLIPEVVLRDIERAGRTCYKSEHKIGLNTAGPFVRRLVQDLKHESVIEHGGCTVRFICDRGVSHELVRHRLCAFSQESTRYCNYGADGKAVVFIRPCFWQPGTFAYLRWEDSMRACEDAYLWLLMAGSTPQQARSVLPNSLKTEIVVTANWREWRHILKLRTSPKAHPQMRQVMVPLLAELARSLPELFDDLVSKSA